VVIEKKKKKFFVFIFGKEKHFFSCIRRYDGAYQRKIKKRKPSKPTKEQKREREMNGGSDQMNWKIYTLLNRVRTSSFSCYLF
jgi:hypothetical protein